MTARKYPETLYMDPKPRFYPTGARCLFQRPEDLAKDCGYVENFEDIVPIYKFSGFVRLSRGIVVTPVKK